jgi:hypothetical protein
MRQVICEVSSAIRVQFSLISLLAWRPVGSLHVILVVVDFEPDNVFVYVDPTRFEGCLGLPQLEKKIGHSLYYT